MNVALYMLLGAMRNWYDRALLVSRDSDLAPAVWMVVEQFPSKEIRIVTPAWRGQSLELAAAARLKYCTLFKPGRVRNCLLPREIKDCAGNTVAIRPPEYDS